MNSFSYDSLAIAETIKKVAKERNVVAKNMLSEIGLSSNAMSSFRHGKMPSASNLAKIADYLDCSVDYLLGRTDNPNAHNPGEIEHAFYAAPPPTQDVVKKILDIK